MLSDLLNAAELDLQPFNQATEKILSLSSEKWLRTTVRLQVTVEYILRSAMSVIAVELLRFSEVPFLKQALKLSKALFWNRE